MPKDKTRANATRLRSTRVDPIATSLDASASQAKNLPDMIRKVRKEEKKTRQVGSGRRT